MKEATNIKSLLILTVLIIPAYFPGQLHGEPESAHADILERCRDCRLTFADQEDIRGRLLYLGDDYLEIAARESPVTKRFQSHAGTKAIPFDDILQMRCGEPWWDGPVWGFMAGGFIGATLLGMGASMMREPGYEYEDSTGEVTLKGLLIGGGIGALFGCVLDIGFGHPRETKNMQEWLDAER